MLHLKSADLKKEKIESLVIPVCEDKNIHEDKTILSLVRSAKKVKAFKGNKDDEVILYNLSEVKTQIIIFLGLGKLEKVDMEALRTMAGKAVKGVIKKKTYRGFNRCAFGCEGQNGYAEYSRSNDGRCLSRESSL